jgi:GTP1/Obg family GTP-binding protein
MESAISVIKERLDKSHSLKKQLERMQNDYTTRSSASIKQETDEEIFEKVLKETALLINESRDDLKVLLEILRLLRKLPSEKSR